VRKHGSSNNRVGAIRQHPSTQQLVVPKACTLCRADHDWVHGPSTDS
jgi:hypothetical protein